MLLVCKDLRDRSFTPNKSVVSKKIAATQKLGAQSGPERINKLIKSKDERNINSSHIRGSIMLEHSTAAAMVADLNRSRNRKLVTDRLAHEQPSGSGGDDGDKKPTTNT